MRAREPSGQRFGVLPEPEPEQPRCTRCGGCGEQDGGETDGNTGEVDTCGWCDGSGFEPVPLASVVTPLLTGDAWRAARRHGRDQKRRRRRRR